jgi:hypothetical protein
VTKQEKKVAKLRIKALENEAKLLLRGMDNQRVSYDRIIDAYREDLESNADEIRKLRDSLGLNKPKVIVKKKVKKK